MSFTFVSWTASLSKYIESIFFFNIYYTNIKNLSDSTSHQVYNSFPLMIVKGHREDRINKVNTLTSVKFKNILEKQMTG